MILALQLGTLIFTQALAQVPIPTRVPGYTYRDGSSDAFVQLDMFIDLLCPDSKSAYPALQKVSEKLSKQQFRLRFHQFPLPYHQHAFTVAQASNTITSALGEDQFTLWMETMYSNQDLFWNKPTQSLGQKEVTKLLGKLAKRAFPALTDAMWKKGMTGHGGTDIDSDTRTLWKYACTRGISGTPMYVINEVPINADVSWTYEDWMKVIQPLLPVEVQTDARLSEFDSKPVNLQAIGSALPDRKVVFTGIGAINTNLCVNSRPCEYLQGRTMCCSFGEACILGSGCYNL